MFVNVWENGRTGHIKMLELRTCSDKSGDTHRDASICDGVGTAAGDEG